MVWAKVDPMLVPLRHEPGYLALLQKMNLPK
jgi:hypothetical protein